MFLQDFFIFLLLINNIIEDQVFQDLKCWNTHTFHHQIPPPFNFLRMCNHFSLQLTWMIQSSRMLQSQKQWRRSISVKFSSLILSVCSGHERKTQKWCWRRGEISSVHWLAYLLLSYWYEFDPCINITQASHFRPSRGFILERHLGI